MTVREWLNFHFTMHRNYTKYLGHTVLKTPFDWIVIGDIIHDTEPEVIIEVGSGQGGFTLWMANLLDAMETKTGIISIDLRDAATKISHKRIKWIVGDALARDTLEQVRRFSNGRRGMVIEDSDHKYQTTKGILEAYEGFVAVNHYLIVEDTIVDFLDLPPFPGPLKAVREFMASHQGIFVVDRSREKYIITHNPMGYLLRVKETGSQHDMGR
jgi:cephalosporin hydroxylase